MEENIEGVIKYLATILMHIVLCLMMENNECTPINNWNITMLTKILYYSTMSHSHNFQFWNDTGAT